MATVLTLEVPDDIYELLLRKARKTRLSPEQLALDWVQDAAKESDDDPLLRLAGTVESSLGDISERHDQYIGQSLRPGND